MTDTFRALCAELVKAWDATADFDFNDFGHAAADIVTRARAALAQPEPLSLKEQAYDAYWVLRYGHGGDINETQKWNTIRRALEGQ